MRYALLILSVYCSIGLQAGEKLNFQTIDIRAGLSDNFIQDIVQDRYGFIWLATTNGINRYDGYRVKQYTTREIGAYNNNVEAVVEDKGGTLWLKTPVGYYYYNRQTDRIEKNLEHVLHPLGIAGEVKLIVVDEDANLWCIADRTLFYYNYTQKQLYKLLLTDEQSIISIVARQGQAYILFQNGLLGVPDWENGTINKEAEISLSSYEHHKMYMDSNLNLWFYTQYSPEKNIRYYNTTSQQWENPFPGHDFNSSYIVCLRDDGKGNIWIGTSNKGIYIYQSRIDSFMHVTKDKNDIYSLPDNHIQCFFKDQRNNMWIGTSKCGVAFGNLDKTTFESYSICEQEDINTILQDHAGNFWFGSDGEGLTRYNPSTGQLKRYTEKEGTIPSDVIVCSFKDSKNRIWIGTYGGGICYYENNRFHTLVYPTGKGESDPLQYIRCIAEDEYGNIWIGTIVQGLYCYDTQGEFTAYTMNNSILKTGSITDLLYHEHTLYIATSSGLFTMDTQKRQLNFITHQEKINLYLSDLIINSIYRDSRGLLWIGGQKGLSIYDEIEDTLFYVSEEQKGLSGRMRSITEDQHKNIWVTTDLGISNIVVVHDPESSTPKFRCYHYNEEDGTGKQTFNYHAIYCTTQGEILFGGTNGIIKTRPQIVRNNPYNPQVIFTGIYLSNQWIETGDTLPDGRVLLKKNIQLSDEITVDYSDYFTLEVSAMNYETKHNTHFLYRMGNNEEWIRLSDNRIYFNRLASGAHQVEVKISNENGEWSSTPSVMTIHVQPPFWLSATAYFFYFLLATGVVFYSTMRIRRKHRLSMELQRKEMEIAQQREMDEAKLRFFTNISHDLRTPLSLIITPLEKLLGNPTIHIQEDLKLIHRNAQLLVNQVNQLLDFRKLENEKSTLHPSYGNLSEFIKEICTHFESYSMRKDIHLSLRLKSPVLNTNFDRSKMQRILMNLISNAFKYNTEKGSIVITVDQFLGPNGPLARIQVADTGIGIKEENKEKIFDRFYQESHSLEYIGSGIGLHIVKEYVHMHGGEINVKDNSPQGSIFVLTIPMEEQEEIVNLTHPEETTEHENEEPDSSQTTILVVEDNNDFRTFLVDCLKNQYRVFDASNGKEALGVLAKQSVQMVISDVMMPVMDGLELCHKIKNDIRFSHIPIILLTARSREEHIVDGLKEGADEYITKPFNLDILLLRIEKLLEWKQENHKKFPFMDVSPSEITISTLDEQLMEKCIQLVEDNISNTELSVEELSAAVGMSRGHLYKKLMSITGKSPLDFICTIRIKRGYQLLEKSQLSISEIAYKIGLSPKQFSKYFKEEYGVLPSEYKRGLKEKERP